MRVLVSNDDGVDAPGIRDLAEAPARGWPRGHGGGPDRDRSGASNSLTLDQPIRAMRAATSGTWSVAGTPTDCVHLALAGMLDDDPDIVVSGINNSLQPRRRRDLFGHRRRGDGRPLPRACRRSRCRWSPPTTRRGISKRPRAPRSRSCRACCVDPLPADTILNVNVPDLPWDEIRGFEVTPPRQSPPRRALHRAERSARPADLVDRPGRRRRRTPAPAPISTPCATATSRSRRSTST